MAMVVIITFLAFIVNVGLFVKAKINLQNAVDAAAFSGAAVQARYLTNMAYINWEMRNTYKEWMFKYYVLGQLGLDNTISPKVDSAAQMNFRLQPFYNQSDTGFYSDQIFDKYNLPSICIHYGSEHNICEILTVPGLPRFETVGLPNISERHESFLNAIVATKADDCSARSDVNFGTAMLWAYGTGDGKLSINGPQIAANRVGAWPQAFELALRMRNLEAIVNVPPRTEGICLDGADGCTPISALQNFSPNYPLYERSSKAFWSAFKNLSGGTLKEDGGDGDEFSSTFKLIELAPNPFVAEPLSLSGYLIPPNSGGGVSALTKHYVDLQAYPLNIATFFTTFVTTTDRFKTTETTKSEASCGSSKTALPVPGYLFGFSKNPHVLTYYAVKGEANYIGLFYPFSAREGIKLKAYAAAKPFGGKIGPKLFGIRDGRSVVARQDVTNLRSSSYVMALNTDGLPNNFEPGLPIPWDPQFWAKPTDAFGGTPAAGEEVKFIVPNLLYDFDQIGEISGQSLGSPIQKLNEADNLLDSTNTSIDENRGLYDGNQFRKFKENMINPASVVLSDFEIQQTLDQVRRPTRYEAMNYLIPTKDLPTDFFDSPSFVIKDGNNRYSIFAPLFGDQALYRSPEEIKEIMANYLNGISKSVEAYVGSMKKVADDIRLKSVEETRGSDSYIDAANHIHTNNFTVSGVRGEPQCDKVPIASRFSHFFGINASEQCGIKPLKDLMVEYLSRNINPDFYFAPWEDLDPKITPSDLRAAYMPGPRQGATTSGYMNFPFTTAKATARRNFYSTKLFAVEKIINSGGNYGYDESFPTYIEKAEDGIPTGSSDADLIKTNLKNRLKASFLQEFGKYYH